MRVLLRYMKRLSQLWYLLFFTTLLIVAFFCSIIPLLSRFDLWLSGEPDTIISQDFSADRESPDHLWRARVTETVYEGLMTTVYIADVTLISLRNPSDSVVILHVDTGGHRGERPRVRWTSSDTLRVHVWNMRFVTVARRDHACIHVDLDVDPEGEQDWQAYLHQSDHFESK